MAATAGNFHHTFAYAVLLARLSLGVLAPLRDALYQDIPNNGADDYLYASESAESYDSRTVSGPFVSTVFICFD